MNDDPAESGVLAQGLSAEGWSVHLAPNRSDALSALESSSFEALVVDLQMPEEAGLSVVERSAEGGRRDRAAHGMVLDQGPVVIGVTEKSDAEVLARAARAGAHDVLEKPISAAQVEERVGLLLRRRTSMPATPADLADTVLGETPAMRGVRDQIRGLSHFPDLPVLIVGERGTGRRAVARAVHESTAAGSAITYVPCTAIPEAAFEAELFGRELDGTNGAKKTRVGLLEAAGSGTLYFDEIAELPAALIPKLLKVLETRSFRRLGGERDLPFQARVIGATTRQAPEADDASAELHRRLSGFTIALPPLRDRRADVERLARHFLEDYAARRGSPARQLSSWACDVLRERDWPGNVRELRSAVAQAALGPGGHVGFAEISAVLPETERAPPRFSTTPPNVEPAKMEPLRELEHRMIREAWELSGRNLTAAARSLGLPRTTLRDRLKRYGLR